MKRGTCALGLVIVGLWVAGDRIAAQEAPGAQGGPVPPVGVGAKPASSKPAATSETPGVPRVFAELLFLKPTLDDTYFAVASPAASSPPNGPSGQRVNDDFDFEPAFRLGAGYRFAESGREVELSYTRLEAEATKTVAGDFLWATRGSPHFATSFEDYPGTASADIDALLQRIDAHVTQPWQFSGVDLGLQLGFEWADFRVGERYAYVNTASATPGSVSSASRSWGIGPEVGLGLAYQICGACGIPGAFSLSAGSSIGLLLSETHTRASSARLGTPLLSVRDDQTSRVLPAIHARVGLGYALALADRVGATVGVGYQVDSYLRGLTRTAFVDDIARGQSATDYYDFDAQGVYASLGVVF